MGIFDRLFGEQPSPQQPAAAPAPVPAVSSDEEAVRRYRYLLRTAPPEAIEQAHAEAFAQLTPEQRARALQELGRAVPESERAAVSGQADPQSMARLATRAEIRQPGVLERVFGGGGGGASLGGVIGGSLLGSIAGSFIGSAIAHELLGGYDDHATFQDEPTQEPDAEAVADENYNDDVAEPADDFGGGGDDFGSDFDV